MFDSIGWGEIVVIALTALFIFGPERLPGLAQEAAGGLKRVRSAVTGVRAQVSESLGDDLPDLRDLDLRRYHPRTFLRDQLLGDDDAPPVRRSSGTGATASGLAAGATATGATPGAAAVRDRALPPPFDLDAT